MVASGTDRRMRMAQPAKFQLHVGGEYEDRVGNRRRVLDIRTEVHCVGSVHVVDFVSTKKARHGKLPLGTKRTMTITGFRAWGDHYVGVVERRGGWDEAWN